MGDRGGGAACVSGIGADGGAAERDDVITLRDGGLLRGRVATAAGDSVRMVLIDGSVRTVRWTDIATRVGPSFAEAPTPTPAAGIWCRGRDAFPSGWSRRCAREIGQAMPRPRGLRARRMARELPDDLRDAVHAAAPRRAARC